MDKKTHDKGLEIRKAVLGEAYVSNALKNADEFNKPFQELVTEYCGVTKNEIREIFMQVAIYAGVPAGVDSFRIAREVFAELDKG